MSEASLTLLGRRLMQTGKAATAVKLLEWSAQQYPKSVKVQNGLAEAYATAGNKVGAKAATAKALKMAESDPGIDPALRKAVNEAAAQRLKASQ